jgi:hypothetical protein
MDRCYYCGLEAKGTDALMRHIKRVPICQECRRLLRSRIHSTLAARKAELKELLEGRHWRKLMCSWTQEELDDMGVALRTTVNAGIAEAEQLKRRLAW